MGKFVAFRSTIDDDDVDIDLNGNGKKEDEKDSEPVEGTNGNNK